MSSDLNEQQQSSTSPVATLCVTRANGEIDAIQLFPGQSLRIGRSENNDLTLAEVKISRFHLVFSASQRGVVLSDLNSLNGTFVNNRRLKVPRDLNSGDLVQLGDTKIVVHFNNPNLKPEDTAVINTQALQLQSIGVTVLLSDVCGYTRLSETLPPVEVAQMLKNWCQIVSDIVVKFGGEVDKFIGDCVMSIWRSDSQHGPEWGARQSVLAAHEIAEQTQRLAQSAEWKYGAEYPWRCRQAINTGEALFGSVVDGPNREVSVLGDTINVAFRLQDLGSKLDREVILSDSTAEYIRASYALEQLGSVPIEGKLEEINVFSLSFNSTRDI